MHSKVIGLLLFRSFNGSERDGIPAETIPTRSSCSERRRCDDGSLPTPQQKAEEPTLWSKFCYPILFSNCIVEWSRIIWRSSFFDSSYLQMRLQCCVFRPQLQILRRDFTSDEETFIDTMRQKKQLLVNGLRRLLDDDNDCITIREACVFFA
jgi:hypothetical protein